MTLKPPLRLSPACGPLGPDQPRNRRESLRFRQSKPRCPQMFAGRLLPVDISGRESESHTPAWGIEVATLARQGSSSRSGGKGTRPVSKHPLFPAMVALWFATLFGLGCLAIRPALIESLILAMGIERAIPAIAPPLDVGARTFIAFVLAVSGGLVGLLLGRVLSSGSAGRRESHAAPFPQPRRPFSAEELAEVTFDEPAADQPGNNNIPPIDATPPRERPPQIDLTELQRALLSEKPPRPVLVPAAEPSSVTIDLPVEPEGLQLTAPLGKAAQRLLAADLTTLSPVELVERLGLSMQLQRTGTPFDAVSAPAPRRLPDAPLPRSHAVAHGRADNEQVLRSALAALQRLSGAA